MQTHAFDFDLPQELIALHPCFPRDSARLLCVKEGGGLSDHHIRDLGQLLNRGDLLIVNDTRVLPASLKAKRRRQGDQGETVMLDITLHQPSISSVTSAADGEGVCWSSFVRPAKRLRPGDELIFGEKYEARVEQQLDTGQVLLRFHLSDSDFTDFIENQGMMPLPPYIARKRPVTDKDREDYQTMFALHNGSVAAPTAGLHFTPSLLERLKEKGIDTASVTLHVGAGTFLPVKTEYIEDHSMHAEYYTIGPETAEKIFRTKEKGGRIIAVGTTSLRSLESAADEQGKIKDCQHEQTRLFITPGYKFRCVDGLLTNFHLPRSTLFMLVSAFSGLKTIHRAYAHAITQGYRFYSYGDASLLWHSSS